jgi:RNA polymerase sigma factor (TIGR02999 family)
MNSAPSQEITGLLKVWGRGQSSALDDLIPLVYRELKRLARQHMRGRERETLQATALVHEAYIRLVDLSSVRWQDRAHFFAMAAQIMRGILVDAARAQTSQKRGGLIRRAGFGQKLVLRLLLGCTRIPTPQVW